MEMTEPQTEVALVQANKTTCLYGRGTGKTTMVGAPWIHRVSLAMPGHLSCLLGLSYTHLETNIIPKIKVGLSGLGHIEGETYVTHQKPLKKWDRCKYPIDKYDRTIAYKNGTVQQEISIEQHGSANAFDFQSMLIDEAKLIDNATLEGEVIPTLRGMKEIFGHLPEYLSQLYLTDKYQDHVKIKWLLDMRNQVDHAKVKVVIQLQLHLIELQRAWHLATKADQRKISRYIDQISTRLGLLRKDLVFVSEASALSNLKNLGEKWHAKQKENGEYEYNVAVKNEDPTQSGNCFYPGLREELFYHDLFFGSDYNTNAPLIIALDYQHSIAPLCVGQIAKLPWMKEKSLNFIKEFYAKFPKGLEDVVDDFCAFYSGHRNKFVQYVYDHTAIGKRAGAKAVKDIVVDRLHHHHWNVQEIYTLHPPEHFIKFEKIKKIMEEKEEENGERYMPVRFSRKCVKTKVSMENSGTVINGKGKTEKDKKYENTKRYPKIDQSTTTHFSDTADQIIWAVQVLKKVSDNVYGDGGGLAMR